MSLLPLIPILILSLTGINLMSTCVINGCNGTDKIFLMSSFTSLDIEDADKAVCVHQHIFFSVPVLGVCT